MPQCVARWGPFFANKFAEEGASFVAQIADAANYDLMDVWLAGSAGKWLTRTVHLPLR